MGETGNVTGSISFQRLRSAVALRSRMRALRLWAGSAADRRRNPTAPVAVIRDPVGSVERVRAMNSRWFYSGRNARFATASTVAWVGERMVIGDLLNQGIVVCAVHTSGPVPLVTRLGSRQDNPIVGDITSIDCTPDGRLVVWSDSASGFVRVVSCPGGVDELLDRIDAGEVRSVQLPSDVVLHGAAVTNEATMVLWSSIDDPGGIRIAGMKQLDGDVHFGDVSELSSPYAPLKPKGLAHSPDGRYLAVAHGPNVTTRRRENLPGFVELRTFDAAEGRIGEVVARSTAATGLVGPEDCAFTPDGTRLIVTDQTAEQVVVLSVDLESGTIESVPVLRIGRAAGELRSPHGCAVSPDGRWLAVTNYGNSTVCIFDLDSASATPSGTGSAAIAAPTRS